MLIIQNLSYSHPNGELLFQDLNLTINAKDKIAIIGNNGVGKSTLLKIIAQEIEPSEGIISNKVKPYYIPQVFGQFNHLTIAQALRIDSKLNALYEILNGNVDSIYFSELNDDWTVEERCQEALNHWELSDLDLSQTLASLSGGQKTKVFLAGIYIHQPELILLDEPSNHLDLHGRELLYEFIQSTNATLIIISHDRKLLNLLTSICELSKQGIKTYGGNYDFYVAQKEIENNALNQDILDKEKALRKAKEKEQKTAERQQRLDNRGHKKQTKAGMGKAMMDKMKNDSENSTAKLKGIHSDKVNTIKEDLQNLRLSSSNIKQMKFDFDNTTLHKGKVLFKAENINFNYSDKEHVWKQAMNLQIVSGERIVIKGKNGSGKTTLIKVILKELVPNSGEVHIPENNAVYIDQNYSLIDNNLQVYEQAQQFNKSGLLEHEIKIRLNRFLFTQEDWDKSCHSLSGGERMRLMLCCLNILNQSPDIIILDEPTNNLDIQNIEILTNAINDYQGTLIVISHDESFLEQINIERIIQL